MFEWLLERLTLDDPSNYEDFYEDVNYETFHPDERIWQRNYRANRTYLRTMQVAFVSAMDRIDELTHEIARSANFTYLEEAKVVRESYSSDKKRIALLEAENEKLQVLYEFYRDRMLELDEKITARQESKEASKMNPTVKEGNKFASVDGITKMDKIKLATCYEIMGYSVEEIAKELNVKTNTAKQYIATATNHYQLSKWHGERMIQWDKEYGDESWSLEQFVKTDSAEATTTTTKTLDIPIPMNEAV